MIPSPGTPRDICWRMEGMSRRGREREGALGFGGCSRLVRSGCDLVSRSLFCFTALARVQGERDLPGRVCDVPFFSCLRWFLPSSCCCRCRNTRNPFRIPPPLFELPAREEREWRCYFLLRIAANNGFLEARASSAQTSPLPNLSHLLVSPPSTQPPSPGTFTLSPETLSLGVPSQARRRLFAYQTTDATRLPPSPQLLAPPPCPRRPQLTAMLASLRPITRLGARVRSLSPFQNRFTN